ncbi:hypothetical protein BaRGS_00002279 [Batillaria attramentaria]|uniref:Uncharacterized protein n=1 Tax=Batillaria attramentaria TaxID=370345 RepID=A0ABD0M3G6_9CAEN
MIIFSTAGDDNQGRDSSRVDGASAPSRPYVQQLPTEYCAVRAVRCTIKGGIKKRATQELLKASVTSFSVPPFGQSDKRDCDRDMPCELCGSGKNIND